MFYNILKNGDKMIRYKSLNKRTKLQIDMELFWDTWYYSCEEYTNVYPFEHFRKKNISKAYCLLWRGIMSKKSLTK